MRIHPLSALLVLALSLPAAAATGDIDLSFGDGGVRAVDFDLGGDKQDTPHALIEIENGELAAVGTVAKDAFFDVGAIAALSADGDLLLEFDGNGKQTYSYNDGYDTSLYGAAASTAQGGSLVAAGFVHGEQNLSDHSGALLSMDFSGSQWVVQQTPMQLEFYAVQRDNENNHYLAGAVDSGSAMDFYVVRLNANLEYDGNFGTAGTVRAPIDLGGSPKADYAVAVAPYGSGVLVAGVAEYNGIDHDFAVVKLTDDGTLDTSFSDDGIRSVGFDLAGSNDNDRLTAMAIDSSGRILLAGHAARNANGSDTDIAVTRLLPNGLIDTSFGDGGKKVASFDAADPTKKDELAAILVQADGRIWLLGTRYTGQASGNIADVALMRLTVDGDVDTSFGDNGVRTYGFSAESPGGKDQAAAMLMQADGKLVILASKEWSGADTDFVLTRLSNDFDPSDSIFKDGFN